MSSASSNQSFVRDGAAYEELYPSGYRDLDELSERSPSATSPSLKNEDMELAEPEEGSDDDDRSEEHTSELQSQDSIAYAVFCL